MINPDAATAAWNVLCIQQLAIRYAVCVDQRDIHSLSRLYVPDVDCGHWGRGRDAVVRMYNENDSTMGVSIHVVSNHLIDLVDDTHATGVVYLHAEHQQHDRTWARLAGAYEDRYELQDGTWLFAKRRLLFWYRDSNALPSTVNRDTSYRVFEKWPTLPHAWPSWPAFWNEVGEASRIHPSTTRVRN